eukprot:TRINITY_DN7432_c0_g1_i2.p1 TRINITY_DN7432_c0_g1~~TRINITY_DN7432_c0_g1_i2.p1  ORF type:complete len:644 (+),score=99.66 TRINITY_DN7432_c0_g1_i2:167-1933(+)
MQRASALLSSRSTLESSSDFGGLEGIEASLMSMAEEGATPELAPFIDQISQLVSQMKVEVSRTATSAQTSLDASWNAFLTCNQTSMDLSSMNASLRNCWTSESAKYSDYTSCTALCDVKNATAAVECQHFSAKDVFPNPGFCKWPTQAHTMSTFQWMGILKTDFQTQLATWNQLSAACNNATTTANDCYAGCQTQQDALAAKRLECDTLQGDMESAACGDTGDACSRYQTCYSTKQAAWISTNTSVALQEAAYIQEYRGILRVECLLGAFNLSIQTGTNLSMGLATCQGTTYTSSDWSTIQISYYDVSANPLKSCISTSGDGSQDSVPGSSAWNLKYFSNLPTGVVAAACSATCCYTNCSTWTCSGGWYPNGSASEGFSNDDCCIAYNGTCQNGQLAPLAQRTKENQCASCDSSYYLQASDDSCQSCVAFNPAGGSCTGCSEAGCTVFSCYSGYTSTSNCSLPFDTSTSGSCCNPAWSFSGEQTGLLVATNTCGGSKPGDSDKGGACTFASGRKYICDGTGCEDTGILDKVSCAYFVDQDAECSSSMSWNDVSTGNNECICWFGAGPGSIDINNAYTDARTYVISAIV